MRLRTTSRVETHEGLKLWPTSTIPSQRNQSVNEFKEGIRFRTVVITEAVLYYVPSDAGDRASASRIGWMDGWVHHAAGS